MTFKKTREIYVPLRKGRRVENPIVYYRNRKEAQKKANELNRKFKELDKKIGRKFVPVKVRRFSSVKALRKYLEK